PLRAGVEGGGGGATLLEVIDRTLTPMGGRLLRRWLLAPLVDPAAISARLDAVAVLVADGRGRERLREALDGVRDVERLAGRAALGRATPREMGALRDSILRLPDVAGALGGVHSREQSESVDKSAHELDLLTDLGDELSRALVERPPAQLDDGDSIKAGYDHELDERIAAREAAVLDQLRRRVADAIARVQSTAGHLARCDVWAALADVAERERYVRPDITDDFTLALEGSRHPVVERMMAREAFIPN